MPDKKHPVSGRRQVCGCQTLKILVADPVILQAAEFEGSRRRPIGHPEAVEVVRVTTEKQSLVPEDRNIAWIQIPQIDAGDARVIRSPDLIGSRGRAVGKPKAFAARRPDVTAVKQNSAPERGDIYWM